MRSPFQSYYGNRALAACLIGFFLLIPAFYNGFPLVTSDSGAYIENAFKLYMPNDRSPGYSFFLRVSSLGISLWFTVVVQAIITGHLMDVVLRHFLGPYYSLRLVILTGLLTGVCTSSGWMCGQLMPDIFTAILALTLITIFFIPADKKWEVPARYVLVFFCLLIHNSHILIAFCFGALLFLYAWRQKRPIARRRALAVTGIAVGAWLTLASLYAGAGRGFTASPSAPVFMMSRMAENGILDKYLAENCWDNKYKICAYRSQWGDRQWDFMWEPGSPLYKTGGWDSNREEYSRIVRGTLTKPKFLAMHMLKNGEAAIRQLPLIYVGDGLGPHGDKSNPYWKVDESFNHQMREYRSALQQHSDLNLPPWNALIILFFVSAVACLLLLPRHITSGYRNIFLFLLLFIFINSAMTATFATIVARYQARVVWLVPFLCVILIAKAVIYRQLSRDTSIQ